MSEVEGPGVSTKGWRRGTLHFSRLQPEGHPPTFRGLGTFTGQQSDRLFSIRSAPESVRMTGGFEAQGVAYLGSFHKSQIFGTCSSVQPYSGHTLTASPLDFDKDRFILL